MINKKNFSLKVIWYLAAFLFLLIWFTRIHPLSVLDGDDWTYTTYARTALPLWGDWNPSRVLPEVLMPLCSSLGAYLLYPILGDYLLSLTVMHGLVVTLFIMGYLYAFDQMMKRVFSLSESGCVFASALFLIFHFLIFRKYDSGNGHMFYCFDLTCVYYYLIPGLLNGMLVMCLIGNRRLFSNANWEKKSLILTAVYFAIFSNLPASGILAAFCGSVVLTDLIRCLCQKDKLTRLFREDFFYLAVLGVWLVSAVFELAGGRASADMGVSAPFLTCLKEAVYSLLHLYQRCSIPFLATSVLLMAAALILALRSKDSTFLSLFITCMIAIAASAVYTAVLCSAVDRTYINRVEYLFGLLFLLILTVLLCFGYVLQKIPGLLCAVPIGLCILASCCHTTGATYLESNYPSLAPEVCDAITNQIIDAIVAADQQGLTEADVRVPSWPTPDNWPHPLSVTDSIADALYEHGITSRRIDLHASIDTHLNQTYNIPIN